MYKRIPVVSIVPIVEFLNATVFFKYFDGGLGDIVCRQAEGHGKRAWLNKVGCLENNQWISGLLWLSCLMQSQERGCQSPENADCGDNDAAESICFE